MPAAQRKEQEAQVPASLAEEQQRVLLANSDPANTNAVLPEGYVPFLKTEFSAEYEAYARTITNPDGQHNSAFDPEKFKQMPPQTHLVKVWGWFHGKTGFSVMFLWASGRQDAWCLLDNPSASDEAIARQSMAIEQYKDNIENFKREVEHVN